MTEPAAQPHDSPARRWTRQWGVTRSNRLTELTAVAIFAILCALLWLPNWREERVNSLRERRDRYGDISQHGRNIAYAVLEMRAAVRGYLLSGRPEFRAEYVEAGNRVQSASDELEALITTQDDPALADAHAAYAVALTSWRSGHLEYLVAMVDRGDTAEAQAYFVGGHGQQQVTEAQTQLAAIQSLAHDYERTIRTEITSLSAFVVLLNNGLLGLALIAMALVVVGYAQQRRTNAALRRADSVNQRLSQQLEAELSAAEQRNTLLDAGQQLLNQLPVFQQADDALEQLAWTVLRVYDLTAVAIWIDSTARGGYVAQHVIAQSSFSAGLPPPARLSVQSGKMTSVERGAGQLWYVPIEWDGVVVGVCALGGDPARIDVEHIRQQVLLSIENVVLFQQLRRNEARLHAVFSHAPLGFVLTDRTGMVLLANQRAQAVLPWVAAGEDACRPDAHGSFFAQGGAPIATSALPLAKAVASCDAQRAEIFHEQDGVRIP
ncbi:MAG: hypothetical protein RLZZ297_931, partial [Chloroflexota bacterium]